jgi:hypothetical protein
MSKDKPTQAVRMRIIVVAPPPGVRFAVQRGRSELLEPSAEHVEAIQFDFSLRLGSPLPEGPNFLGEFAQGSPSDRFVYVNSGTLAGQTESCWSRRAKLKLASIPHSIVEAAAATAEAIIEVRVPGTMGDGGPVCASVKPQAVIWSLVQNVAQPFRRADMPRQAGSCSSCQTIAALHNRQKLT